MSLPLYEPMLATKRGQPFDDEGWWFEVKWDGYRAVVGNDGGRVRARSRKGLDLTGPFPELSSVPLPAGVVVDGEIVAFDTNGLPSFSLLQRRTGFGGEGTGARVGVNLVVFDVLFEEGEPLLGLPYEERRARLAELDLQPPLVVPDPTPTRGTALFEATRGQGIEGIVAKRLGSVYVPGKRSPDWQKISVRRRMRAVIGGYVPGEGGRSSSFGSVLVGLYRREGLYWIGAVGSGFDDSSLTAFAKSLRQLEREDSPFVNDVVVPQKPVWVEPGLVVSVEFKEWTKDLRLRAPVYKGIELADPETVTWEEEGPEP